MPFVFIDNKEIRREKVGKNKNYLHSVFLRISTSAGVLMSTQCTNPSCVSPLFALPLQPCYLQCGFTFFCVLKHICKRTWNSALYECTTDWQYPFQFCCSKLIIENVFWIIYGNNSIVMLAHTDHKHKKNLSNAKEINWFWISHIFCIATDLHTSNCRFQMSESIRLPTGSPDCFQQNSFVCTFT